MEETDSQRYDIVPTHLVVQAMRDNGYKNAAYAIAELMDNSIQAKASRVELLCAEEEELVAQRTRRRLKNIAVLDNGVGMDADTLRLALQFGNGTHLQKDQQKGIGRFGMGLPASSISQCKRVEVWSWQSGVENAVYSYLDIDEIKNRTQASVPIPEPHTVPSMWREVGGNFGESGTLVVWSKLDRCMWKSASAVILNSEFLIGRMYRRFLNDKSVGIRLASFDTNAPALSVKERPARPNDPGYLMEQTSCPEPYHDVPLFEPRGEQWDQPITVRWQNEVHTVMLRFSMAKSEARRKDQAGSTGYGEHAQKNVGVSLMRAKRELDLDQALVRKYDSRERWWGVEVDFPPALDELFGVTNNKQFARNFTDVATLDSDTLLADGKSSAETREDLKLDGDPTAILLDIIQPIKRELAAMRGIIQAQTKGNRATNERYQSTAEETATARTKQRQQEGHQGQSDKEEQLPVETRRVNIHDALVEQGVSEDVAEILSDQTVDNGLKYLFATAELEGYAFFSVRPKGGALIITLNTKHPAYDKLVDILEENVEGVEATELRERLTKALAGLKLLLTAWARYEDEELNPGKRTAIQDARNDWGLMARKFLDNTD